MIDIDRMGRMSVSETESNIIISIPKDLMVFAQKERPDFPLNIIDDKGMSRWICRHLLRFGGDSESGVTEFELFLDKMFIEAYESAENWIQEERYE